MVRWLVPILLIAMSLAAIPGRVSFGCDAPVAEAMGCSKPTPAPEAKAAPCCGQDASEPSSAVLPVSDGGTAHGCGKEGDAGADHACPMCAVICGALCERASPWGLLGFGAHTLTSATPVSAPLPESAWLPRETSARFPAESAFVDVWLTFDRPRRQAKLCLWTV